MNPTAEYRKIFYTMDNYELEAKKEMIEWALASKDASIIKNTDNLRLQKKLITEELEHRIF